MTIGGKQPGPRREVAQEFWGNIVALGELARDAALFEMKNGLRPFSFTDIRELELNIEVCKREQEKYL